MSAIGAGDAFLAGYLAARYTGRPHGDALRFAVACGAESTQHLGAGVLDPRAAERLEHEVVLTELERAGAGRRARLTGDASPQARRSPSAAPAAAAGSRRAVGNIGRQLAAALTPLPSSPASRIA